MAGSFQPVSIPFIGDLPEDIWVRTFGEMNTIGSGSVSLHINVKNKKNIAVSQTDAQLQPYNCTFTPNGTVYLYNKLLEVCDLELPLEMCENEFEELYSNQFMGGYGAGANGEPSTNLIDFAISIVEKTLVEQIETLGWLGGYTNPAFTPDPYGSQDYLTYCVGLLQKLEDDTETLKIDGNAITPSNVITEIQSMITKLPANVVSRMMFQNMWLHVSPNIYTALYNAKTSQTQALEQNVAITVREEAGREIIYYNNIRVNVSIGIPDNTMVLSRPDRLHIGTDLVSDFTTINITSLRAIGEEKIRAKARMRLGTLPIFPSEIVFYRPAP